MTFNHDMLKIDKFFVLKTTRANYFIFKMSFVESLMSSIDNKAKTENGALSYESTGSYLLDFFSKGAALRSRPEDAYVLFEKAFGEDPLLALRALFYIRDVRGGQGERKIFRYILKQMIEQDEMREAIEGNLKYIPDFGRWDDLIELAPTHSKEKVLHIIAKQYKKDQNALLHGRPYSLLAKWMKSENGSSKEGVMIARIIRDYLGIKSSQYRKSLRALRSGLHVLESQMTNGNWDQINYEHVPSYAMKKYFKAFAKHQPEKFKLYKKNVKSGKAKIHSGTLYPYDLVARVLFSRSKDVDEMCTLQWNSLPNYTGGKGKGIAVIDVSGSMTCGCCVPSPLCIAISLGLYMAERIEGIFHNKFITFSESPQIVEIVGETLGEKVSNISMATWGMSTNLILVFKLILNQAILENAPPEHMPEVITIISDMQFDCCCNDNSSTNLDMIKTLYQKAGYEVPQLVFWNVNASSDSPATMNENGVCLISGSSPSILQSIFGINSSTPYDFMLQVLNGDRYACIH